VRYYSFERCSLALQPVSEVAYGYANIWILGVSFLSRYPALFDLDRAHISLECDNCRVLSNLGKPQHVIQASQPSNRIAWSIALFFGVGLLCGCVVIAFILCKSSFDRHKQLQGFSLVAMEPGPDIVIEGTELGMNHRHRA